MSKRSSLIFFTSLLLLPIVTSSHVKWFALPVRNVTPYRINDVWVLSWILISIVVVVLGVYLDRKIKVPNFVNKFSGKFSAFAHTICSVGIGLSLVLFSLNGYLFASNMEVAGLSGTTLILLQGFSGLMIIFGFYGRFSAVLLFLLFIFGALQNGLVEMLDALEILGISLYLFIIGRPKWQVRDSKFLELKTKNYVSYGVPILRIFTGLNLIILGFSEKILNPSLTQSFLSEYHWNFMQNAGFFWFTDYWFAFSAGVMEALIGVFLCLGILTRLTTLALAGFLLTTLTLLGPVELIGHLPHFSIAIVFLLLGSGEKLKV